MGSAAVLDVEDLIRPIPGENPAGEDLRQDLSPTPLYYRIKDVRTAARAAERQGEFEAVIGAAEAGTWRPILEPSLEVLATRSKDLEIAAWLTEALVRTDGFAGLRDGFRLARGLVEGFWEALHPVPDEDGLETRLAALTGLNGAGAEGTLIAPIARIPITMGGGIEPLATWSCRQAIELERLPEDQRQERVAGGAAQMSDVLAAVHGTPVTFFVDLLADVEDALSELEALGRALDERAGADSPPTSAIREALTGVLDTVRYVARDVLPAAEEEPVGPTPGAEPAGTAASSAPQAAPGALQTREDAFRTLIAVADFFRRTEPHSPISFLVERTVRWGRLPLPELLKELIPDQGARETFGLLTGVQSDTGDGE